VVRRQNESARWASSSAHVLEAGMIFTGVASLPSLVTRPAAITAALTGVNNA
jgi:hypothetical protein